MRLFVGEKRAHPQPLGLLAGQGADVRLDRVSDRLAFRCPVQEGRFECPAPVGIWDVRLGATDRIANYLWKVPFPKDAPVTLEVRVSPPLEGELTLRVPREPVTK